MFDHEFASMCQSNTVILFCSLQALEYYFGLNRVRLVQSSQKLGMLYLFISLFLYLFLYLFI